MGRILRTTSAFLVAAAALLWVTPSALAQNGTATWSAASQAGYTLTIGSTTYTYHSSQSGCGAAICVLFGGSASDSAGNMRAAINDNAAQCVNPAGSGCFFNITSANASVTATVCSNVVTVTNITGSSVSWSSSVPTNMVLTPSSIAAASQGQVTESSACNVNVTSASTTGSISLDLSSLGSSNTYLLVGISIVQNSAASTPTVSSIKWGGSGGTALTQVCSASETASSSNWVSMGIWGLQNPSAISSTVAITLSGSTVFQAGAVAFTHVSSLGTCATQTHKGGDAVSSTSVTVTAPGTGGAVFDTLAVESIVASSSFTLSPTAGQTPLWNLVDPTPPGGANCQSGGCTAGGAGSWAGNVTTMSYSFPGPSLSNSAYGAIPVIAAGSTSGRKGQTVIGALLPPDRAGSRE